MFIVYPIMPIIMKRRMLLTIVRLDDYMKKINLQFIFILLLFLFMNKGFSRDYIIYSVSQELPMGIDDEQLKKNYYVNMGANQGLERGTILDVFRIISRLDPYETKKRYNYKVKVGEIEILHSEEESSIASLKSINNNAKSPLFDIPALMIGDKVDVKVK